MRRFPLLLGAGVAAAVAPAAADIAVGYHRVSFTGTTHVYTVGFSALVAAVAAVGLTASARAAAIRGRWSSGPLSP